MTEIFLSDILKLLIDKWLEQDICSRNRSKNYIYMISQDQSEKIFSVQLALIKRDNVDSRGAESVKFKLNVSKKTIG